MVWPERQRDALAVLEARGLRPRCGVGRAEPL